MSDLIRNQIEGNAVPVPGDEVDTDRIIPARFLKEVTFENMGKYLFIDARQNEDSSLKDHPLNEDKFAGSEIMVVGKNFGCGSSREHAPQAIMRYGIKALIGESFAEIFAGNCKALGIPVVTASKDQIDALMSAVSENPSEPVSISIASETATHLGVSYTISLSKERKQAFLEGTWDELAILKSNADLIKEKTTQLPYFNQFKS